MLRLPKPARELSSQKVASQAEQDEAQATTSQEISAPPPTASETISGLGKTDPTECTEDAESSTEPATPFDPNFTYFVRRSHHNVQVDCTPKYHETAVNTEIVQYVSKVRVRVHFNPVHRFRHLLT